MKRTSSLMSRASRLPPSASGNFATELRQADLDALAAAAASGASLFEVLARGADAAGKVARRKLGVTASVGKA